MCTRTLLLLFLTFSLSYSDCFGSSCQYQSPPEAKDQERLIPVLPMVDREIRRTAPEFIPDTNLVQLSSVDAMERFLLVFVYQNIRGTFLVLASWSKETKETELNLMVRLGEGTAPPGSNITPFDVENYQVFLTKMQKYYKYYYDENGNLVIIEDDCMVQEQADEYFISTYWYYLRDAKRILTIPK